MRKSLIVSSAAVCAALYALGALATAYIESPWGRGQFRPAVVIPAFFATIFGPLVGGIGGAIGTFIADSIKHGGPYMPSLVAAVPGNFVAFYLYGAMVRRFSWRKFIVAGHVSLVVGNVLTALLYTTYVFSTIMPGLIVGLSIWWYITMLPFLFLIVPVLVKAVSKAMPSLVPEDVRKASLLEEMPRKEFVLSLVVPGLVMVGVGAALHFYPDLIAFFFPGKFAKLRPILEGLLKVMFFVTGVANVLCGLIFGGLSTGKKS